MPDAGLMLLGSEGLPVRRGIALVTVRNTLFQQPVSLLVRALGAQRPPSAGLPGFFVFGI